MLGAKKVAIPAKPSDYSNVFFLKKSATKFFKRYDINKHLMNLELDEQLFYGPICSLKPVELETLKIYIRTNLAKSFIQLLKAIIGAPILCIKKFDNNFCLCINY